MANSMDVCKCFYTMSTWATEEDWKDVGLNCPVLLLHGTDDHILSINGAKQLHARLTALASISMVTPPSFVEISDAAHQLCDERPEVVIQLIKTFLTDTCGVSS